MHENFVPKLFVIGVSAVLSLLLGIGSQIETAHSQAEEASSINATQTQMTTEASSNQVEAFANLTTANFEPVEDSLITARQELLDRNFLSAFNAVNNAGSELFRIQQGAEDPNAIREQLRHLSNQINRAHDTLQNFNGSQALQHLNAADVQLLKVTENLPSDPVNGDIEANEEG